MMVFKDLWRLLPNNQKIILRDAFDLLILYKDIAEDIPYKYMEYYVNAVAAVGNCLVIDICN